MPLGICDWCHQQADVHDQVCSLEQACLSCKDLACHQVFWWWL